VMMEGGRSTDARLRMALRPLAAFWPRACRPRVVGDVRNGQRGDEKQHVDPIMAVIGLSLMAFSFLSLAAFGAYLLLGEESTWRISLTIPLMLEPSGYSDW